MRWDHGPTGPGRNRYPQPHPKSIIPPHVEISIQVRFLGPHTSKEEKSPAGPSFRDDMI